MYKAVDWAKHNAHYPLDDLFHLTCNNFIVGTGPVAFTGVKSTRQENIGLHQTIIFDRIVTNVGNSYNKYTGVFTAPTAGLYLFTWNLYTYTYLDDGSGIGAELMHNGNPVIQSFVRHYDHSFYNVLGSLVLDIEVGDVVFLRCSEAGGSLDPGKTSFTGIKIA